MRTTRAIRALSLLALAIFSAACETGTDPEGGSADFQSALQDYQAMDKALASQSLAGFKALGGRTPFSASPAAIEAVASLGQADFGSRLAERLGSATRTSIGPAAAPIISSAHRGKTLVYVPAQDKYAVDPARTGAPANGTRFILYRVDAAGKPIVGQETGHADLIDLGDGSAQDISLQLKVVATGGATVLEYRTTLDDEPARGALTVNGFVQGDGVKLDFDIDVVSRKSQSPPLLDIAFEIGIDARDFSITGQLRGVPEGSEGEGEIDLTVRHGDGSMRVEAEGKNGNIEGTFYLNGDVFATVSGREENLEILDKAGQPVTGVHLLVLQRMWDAFEDVFDFLEDLVDPVDDLVFLGIIL
jgi:hypothetical protein